MNTKNSDKVFRMLFVLAFLLSLASMPNGIATAQVYPSGMVSYWKFDEGSGGIAGDSMGANDGTIYGATWTTGQVGGALSFDGVDDYVNIGNVEALNFERTDTFSFEAWIRTSKRDAFIQHKVTLDNRGWVFIVNGELPPKPGLILSNTWISNSPLGNAVYVWSLTPFSGTDFDHVVVTYDGSSSAEGINFYMNGELTGKHVYKPGPLTDSIRTEQDVNIGSRFPGYGHFQGEMDELAVYNRVLSTEEIQQHYQNGLMGLGYETPPPANQPPVADVGVSYIVDEGGAVTLDASNSSDPDDNIVLYEWDLDNDGGYDDATGMTTNVSFDDDGVYTIGLKVTDEYGEFDTDTAEITVVNVSPTVDSGQGASLHEGDTFTGSGSFTDPGTDTWTATVDYGGGTGFKSLALNVDKTFNLNHTYLDNGDYTVEVCVSDDDGGIGCDTLTVSVANVAPSIETLTVPLDPMQVGTTVETSATFTDPGVLDTHTAVWDWGDDSTSAGTVGGYNVSGLHVYETPGVYTLTLSVEDDDGGVDTATFQYVVIYDPEGGFVTGGGWIWSPLGVYVPDATLEGKATFGFVSKYKKGATVPTGNTEFQFHVADLNFKSTSYDWLVIAGSKAKYKGTGTINGDGEYGFMLSAIDGTPDMFRIKIWDKATGEVIYDNQIGAADDADPVTAIGGGSIVVHKAK